MSDEGDSSVGGCISRALDICNQSLVDGLNACERQSITSHFHPNLKNGVLFSVQEAMVEMCESLRRSEGRVVKNINPGSLMQEVLRFAIVCERASPRVRLLRNLSGLGEHLTNVFGEEQLDEIDADVIRRFAVVAADMYKSLTVAAPLKRISPETFFQGNVPEGALISTPDDLVFEDTSEKKKKKKKKRTKKSKTRDTPKRRRTASSASAIAL
mmetsp:Transcript_17782/g.28784  ORF Transcript_17782/g.28784 Transcript_17782/m.28784 type:complete len:213 (-) Transcript_17782:122-760(-)